MSLNSNSNSHAHNGSLAVVDLFNVDGLVAVVTGGATGELCVARHDANTN